MTLLTGCATQGAADALNAARDGERRLSGFPSRRALPTSGRNLFFEVRIQLLPHLPRDCLQVPAIPWRVEAPGEPVEFRCRKLPAYLLFFQAHAGEVQMKFVLSVELGTT